LLVDKGYLSVIVNADDIVTITGPEVSLVSLQRDGTICNERLPARVVIPGESNWLSVRQADDPASAARAYWSSSFDMEHVLGEPDVVDGMAGGSYGVVAGDWAWVIQALEDGGLGDGRTLPLPQSLTFAVHG
jgi:hypothetical protein